MLVCWAQGRGLLVWRQGLLAWSHSAFFAISLVMGCFLHGVLYSVNVASCLDQNRFLGTFVSVLCWRGMALVHPAGLVRAFLQLVLYSFLLRWLCTRIPVIGFSHLAFSHGIFFFRMLVLGSCFYFH